MHSSAMTTLNNHIHNILTTDALHRQSISDREIARRVKDQEILRLRDGVFVDTSYYQQLSPWELPMVDAAAYFLKHPQAVFSHTTAAQILGLPVPQNQPVHVYIGKNSTAQNSHKTLAKIQKHCLLTEHTEVVELADKVKTTSHLQTVLDCTRMLTAPYGLAVADSALYQNMISKLELQKALRDSKGRHCRKMRTLADLVSEKAESPGESHTRYLLLEMELDFIEQAELFIDGARYRADFLLEKHGIIIEFDGQIKLTNFGAAEESIERERYREKALQNAGYLVFRADWNLVTRRPNDFRAQLRSFIRRAPTYSPTSYLNWQN